MKILVTGYKGYIGSHLFERLKQEGYNPVGIDLKDGEDILHCLPSDNFDYVFHLAACPRVGYSVEKPSYTMKQNVLVTSTLLEWAKDHGVKRVIFSSSSAVNGNGDGVPNSPYGLHKLMNELECQLFSRLYSLDTVCLRYFNAYSEDQGYGGSYSTAICAWMEMIKQSKPLRIDGDGYQTRDLVHVDDIVGANIAAMEYPGHLSGASYDVGTGQSVSMNYIKNFIDSRYDIEWIYAPERKGDVRHTMADITKTKKDLNWEPNISIVDGLKRCFKGVKNES
jgi:nucleoside-diphosphate-sugar epimerase